LFGNKLQLTAVAAKSSKMTPKQQKLLNLSYKREVESYRMTIESHTVGLKWLKYILALQLQARSEVTHARVQTTGEIRTRCPTLFCSMYEREIG
jgi:hypothetical protein